MDPINNPFSPGAGTPPPELAGRDDLRERVRVALHRTRVGRPARSVLMAGLRGVGKTVLLIRMRNDAESAGLSTLFLEASEGRSLPALLGPPLREVLLKLSRSQKTRDLARRALRGLAGFARGLKAQYQDIHIADDANPEPGLADNGDLEQDLTALLLAAGAAAHKAGTALALFVDELQHVREDELAALVVALHRTSQEESPVALVGAGLPELVGRTARAKSCAERLFDFAFVGPLDRAATERAVRRPAWAQGVAISDAAVQRIFEETRGYPYFLQEWGKHAWDVASGPPISVEDVERASTAARAALDEGFFRVRMGRLTPSERKYLQAMASLGEGPHRSGAIARVLGRPVTALGPTRKTLINKGMIWSPAHGDTAFTAPLFADCLMRRLGDSEAAAPGPSAGQP